MSVAGRVVRFALRTAVPEGQHETVVQDTINMNTPNIRINSNITSMMSPVVPRLIYAEERVD